jgi:DNA ligase-1
VQLADVVDATRQVAATPKRSEKVAVLAALLARTPPDEAPATIGLIIGSPRQGAIGVGWSSLSNVAAPPAAESTLTVADVDAAFTAIGQLQGADSQRARREHVHRLFAAATAEEHDFLFRVLSGEMRQGASAGVVTDAVAKASGRPLAEVRRAVMLMGDLGLAARAARRGDDLSSVAMTSLVGVQPMLAATATSVADALELTGPASVEWKLDGARIQVHRHGDDVRVYTRTLHEISARVPEIVSAALSLPETEFALDGESLGLDPDGNPLKFQDTMSVETRLQPFFFDALQVGGRSLIDEALSVRKQALASVAPPRLLLPTLDTADADAADAFAQTSLDAGHEGVMIKALDSPYQAGRRGKTWRKVKPVHTVDLVVLACEWGHGRRSGWLSNLHLGARADDGSFVMVGKTFKGMTDEMLRWQTEEFPKHALGTEKDRAGYVLHMKPDIVVEIALDGVQRSTRYPGGVALRFARVKRYRPDKSPAEADRIERLQGML